jgi:hemoglobin
MGIPALPARRTEITERSDVELLVRRFYQAVIPDPALGPIFHDFGVDWSVHIPKLVDFWAGRLLGEPGYVGNAVGAHQPVLARCGFGPAELARWLELWHETVDELFVGDIAERAKERARLAAAAIGTLSDRHVRAMASVHPGSGCGDQTG